MSAQGSRHLIERAVQGLPSDWPPSTPASSASVEDAAAAAPGQAKAFSDAPLVPPPTPASSQPAPTIPDPISLATLERAGLSVGGQRRSRAIEEWRLIATNLMRDRREAVGRREVAGRPVTLPNAMMVTSSLPGEGKTFCSLNLAATIAQSRIAEVILVDLDAKPGALTELLGLASKPGLFDLMAQPSLNPLALLVPSAMPGLRMLPFGSSLSAHDDVANAVTPLVVGAVERLSRQFPRAILVIDTPPCLATGDAAALAPQVNQIAMVVEAERTQRAEVESALTMIDTCDTITVVLNKTRAQHVGHFASDYYAYYGKSR